MSNLDEILLIESLEIPSGFHEEVYFDKEVRGISFSSPLTRSNFTENENKVGLIQYISFNEFADPQFGEIEVTQNVLLNDQIKKPEIVKKYTKIYSYCGSKISK